MYEAEKRAESLLDDEMQLRRDRLSNYTRLNKDFAGQICRPYQDGLRNCVEHQPKWPMVQKEDPCMDLLNFINLNESNLQPAIHLTNSTDPLVIGSTDPLVGNYTQTEPKLCETVSYLFLDLLANHGFGFGFLMGFCAYVFYVCVVQPFVILTQWLQSYVKDSKVKSVANYTSIQKMPQGPCMSLSTPHELDSTLV